jgi:homoserine kinase type II
MALLTRISVEDARAIVGAFELALESIDPLPALGTVNSNFRVRASGRTWFLRVNEGKAESDVAAEARLVRALGARGVPTPQPLETRDKRMFALFSGKCVSLFPWAAGREAAPDPRDPATVRVAGQALGLIHRANVDESPRNHYTLDELERRLGTFAHDPRLAEIVPSLARELERARQRSRGREGLIHQDLFPDNLLVGDDGTLAAILDFEQATRGPLVYDLAVSVNAWCWDGAAICRTSAEAVLDAWGELSTEEQILFVEESRLAAARFTITRITDVFLPDGVDEDLRRRKDWRDYARRLAWWTGAV